MILKSTYKFWINLPIASQNDSLFQSAPIGSRIKNRELIQVGTSKHVSGVIWFTVDRDFVYRESFGSNRDF